MKEKILKVLNPYIRIFFSLLSIVAFIFFFRYLGVKGMVGFMVGMGLMAYLLLSKNMMVQALINMVEGDEYLDVLGKKRDEE